MNIAMFTNAYDPVIGGLEQSIKVFTEDLRALGHNVLIVTLAFPGAEASDEEVFRLPSVKEIAGTEFSLKLPVPAGLRERLDAFKPDIIHSHHPFMMGDTALRVARRRGIPIVFTHHTLYERYAYQFSQASQVLECMAEVVATEYANLCTSVVAPTRSIEQLIRERGVTTPIEVIPTGIDIDFFAGGRGDAFRRDHDIPQDVFLLGYLGRVVEAKNMDYLMRAVAPFLKQHSDAWFLVVGDGDSADAVRDQTRDAGVADRVVMTGSLSGEAVADAYAAMDLFAFASKTETQGIVLIEGLCAGVPIVALDASGSRDILDDGRNGVLLDADATSEQFLAALEHVKSDEAWRMRLCEGARRRARDFDRKRCAEQLADLYRRQRFQHERTPPDGDELWIGIQERFTAEWDLFKEKLAVIAAVVGRDEMRE